MQFSLLLLLLISIIATVTAQLEICAPPLNTGAPVTGRYSGSNTDMRIVVLVGKSSEELFDRTCGMNGHEDCPDSPEMAGWPIGPTGLFSLPVVNPEDGDLPYVIVLIVPDVFVSSFGPNPLGRAGIPAFLASLSVSQSSLTRSTSWTGNACGSTPRPSNQVSIPTAIPQSSPVLTQIQPSSSPSPIFWSEEDENPFPSMTSRPSRTPSRTPSPWWEEEEEAVTPPRGVLRQQSSATEVTMALSVAAITLFAGVAFLTN